MAWHRHIWHNTYCQCLIYSKWCFSRILKGLYTLQRHFRKNNPHSNTISGIKSLKETIKKCFFMWHVLGNVIRSIKIGMNKASFQAWNIDIWWCKIYRNIRFKLLLLLMATKYFLCGQNWYCLFARYPQNIWEKVCFYHFFIDPILCKDLNTSQ